jgi:hypothetical protein
MRSSVPNAQNLLALLWQLSFFLPDLTTLFKIFSRVSAFGSPALGGSDPVKNGKNVKGQNPNVN